MRRVLLLPIYFTFAGACLLSTSFASMPSQNLDNLQPFSGHFDSQSWNQLSFADQVSSVFD